MEKVKIDGIALDILSIRSTPDLLIIEFYNEIDLVNADLSTIELFTAGNVKCAELKGYDTIYKIDDNTVILSNDGSVYVEPVENDLLDNEITMGL